MIIMMMMMMMKRERRHLLDHALRQGRRLDLPHRGILSQNQPTVRLLQLVQSTEHL
jgi:hypothetical protein